MESRWDPIRHPQAHTASRGCTARCVRGRDDCKEARGKPAVLSPASQMRFRRVLIAACLSVGALHAFRPATCGFLGKSNAAGPRQSVFLAHRHPQRGRLATPPLNSIRLPLHRTSPVLRFASSDEETVTKIPDELSSLTISQLKELLAERGLKVGGTKAKLIDRLEEARAAEEEEAERDADDDASDEEGDDDDVEEEEEDAEDDSDDPPPLAPLQSAEQREREQHKKERGSIGDTLHVAATNPAATRQLRYQDGVEAAMQLHEALLRKIGPAAARSKRTRDGAYAKELVLLEWVIDHARPGDPVSVCSAIERFGEGKLSASSQWLKVAGGAKKQVLQAGVQAAPRGDAILEIGCYVGYSSIRMSGMTQGTQVISLEVDPVHVVVARNVVALAGRASKVDVWTGHSKDLLSRLPHRYGGNMTVSVAFMDQKGSRYEDDLILLETYLLRKGSIVVADNVLKPGAPLYLWRTQEGEAYKSQIARVGEFAMPSEDWISVTAVVKEPTRLPPPPEYNDPDEWVPPPTKQERIDTNKGPEAPQELPELEREADRMRTRARRPGRSVTFQEWHDFAQHMRDRMGINGINATMEPPQVITTRRLRKPSPNPRRY
eukprot:TRINITY_DN40702_c0_g1_i1.p1 TRINITY_DN40702_c0_g1~~TRINITY_DN40702_c0_g1_i1.p1  ORF type:complete len:606 (+),score=72.78 TRINITY_DN40702_c0_g1_i1:50-1867(+)